MAERINGVIVKTLKKMVIDNEKQWDDLLPAALYSYRIKKHTTLKISPYEALFGQPPVLPDQGVLYQVGKAMGFERLIKLWGSVQSWKRMPPHFKKKTMPKVLRLSMKYMKSSNVTRTHIDSWMNKAWYSSTALMESLYENITNELTTMLALFPRFSSGNVL
ncbi:hypothetical protein BCR42DRAFT_444201 [Absidia repens]|uniref:Integrase catalytic domain-containing protein n=1 Tax=Absidia repens TaxID=90262 RepID=A0A1X2HYT6_9FUNG|nr:hypothetical protein BCR42DRAFT_444201 [Absidia repens]